MSVKTSQKPKQVTKKILSPLQDRAFEVVVCRFGLGEKEERETLESIGERYGITRERVRQIENAALQSIRKSDEFKSFESFFEEIKNVIKGLGSVITEDELLEELAKDKSSQNHFLFYLVLSDLFNKEKEDEHFRSRWHVDSDVYSKVHNGLSKFYDSLGDDELIPEAEFVDKFLTHLKDLNQDLKDREVVKRWLNISKKYEIINIRKILLKYRIHGSQITTSQKDKVNLDRNKIAPAGFSTVKIDTLFQDKISIRAIVMDGDKVWYAGNKNRFGFYDLKLNKKFENTIVEDTLKIEFRSIAKNLKIDLDNANFKFYNSDEDDENPNY